MNSHTQLITTLKRTVTFCESDLMETVDASKPTVRRSPTQVDDLERGSPVTILGSSGHHEPATSDASRDDQEVFPSIERTAPASRSPPLFKLTLYRLLFVGLTAGLGSWKAVAASKNQAVTTNTLDWVIGVVLALTWFILGGLSKRPSASTTYAWFFNFNYSQCISGSFRLFAESLFFTVKLSFYAILTVDGLISPFTVIVSKFADSQSGMKALITIFFSLLVAIYLSLCFILAATQLSKCRSPLVGFPHDPFYSAIDSKTHNANLRVNVGRRHATVDFWFRIIAFGLGVLIALSCCWYVGFLAASLSS